MGNINVTQADIDLAVRIANLCGVELDDSPDTMPSQWIADHRTASEQPASGEALDRIATSICRTVAEIPDRSSPDDFPDAMLVTADELHTIVTCALETEAEFAAISPPCEGAGE